MHPTLVLFVWLSDRYIPHLTFSSLCWAFVRAAYLFLICYYYYCVALCVCLYGGVCECIYHTMHV